MPGIVNPLKRLLCACRWIYNYFRDCSWIFGVPNSERSEIGRWGKLSGLSLEFRKIKLGLCQQHFYLYYRGKSFSLKLSQNKTIAGSSQEWFWMAHIILPYMKYLLSQETGPLDYRFVGSFGRSAPGSSEQRTTHGGGCWMIFGHVSILDSRLQSALSADNIAPYGSYLGFVATREIFLPWNAERAIPAESNHLRSTCCVQPFDWLEILRSVRNNMSIWSRGTFQCEGEFICNYLPVARLQRISTVYILFCFMHYIYLFNKLNTNKLT